MKPTVKTAPGAGTAAAPAADAPAPERRALELPGPSSRFFVSQRLRLHYLDWGNEAKPLLLLVHGGRDHAHSWDWVARRLRDAYHVVAPDLRGHGDSAWAIGGMYSQAEFTLDLAQLVSALVDPPPGDRDPAAGTEGALPPPVYLVAHSLGAAVALQYAGLYPARVARLAAIEGLGPPPEMWAKLRGVGPVERLRKWVGDNQEQAAKQPRRYPTIESAMARMQEANAFLSAEQARHLTVHGVMRNEDGTFSWKFDPYVRTFPPYGFPEDETRAIWSAIECPTLLVRGSQSWASDPEQDGRITAFRNATLHNVAGAGHWVHHDRLEDFLALTIPFLAG